MTYRGRWRTGSMLMARTGPVRLKDGVVLSVLRTGNA